MHREGAVGVSTRDVEREGRPRAAGLNGVSSDVFRVKEQAVFAAEGRPARGEYGWYRGASLRPVANIGFAAVFYFYPYRAKIYTL